jgi:hypothetical protein
MEEAFAICEQRPELFPLSALLNSILLFYLLTLRSHFPWRGLNPTVRMNRFHPVGLFGPLPPWSPSPPGLRPGEKGGGQGVGYRG